MYDIYSIAKKLYIKKIFLKGKNPIYIRYIWIDTIYESKNVIQ